MLLKKVLGERMLRKEGLELVTWTLMSGNGCRRFSCQNLHDKGLLTSEYPLEIEAHLEGSCRILLGTAADL